MLTAQIPAPRPLTGWAFVKGPRRSSGASPASTRWDTGSVLAAYPAHAGPDLITRILHNSPPVTPSCSAKPNSLPSRGRVPDTRGRNKAPVRIESSRHPGR